MFKKNSLLYLVSGIFFFSSLLFADIYSRNLLPFGEVEAFTGNAGTGGGLSSSSAVYYNPAALSQIKDPRIAVSASSYIQSSLSAEYNFQKDRTTLPFRVSSFQSVPGTVASIFHNESFTWGYFILVPESLQSDLQLSFTTAEVEISSLSHNSGSDIWGGVSGSWPLSENISLGASLFFVRHETSLIATQNTTDKTKTNTAAFIQSYLSGTTSSFSSILGVYYRLFSWTSLGLRIQSPFLHLSGDGAGTLVSNKVDNGTLTQNNVHEEHLNVRYQLPLDFTLGATFSFAEQWQIFTDASLQTPLTYNTIEGSSQFANRLNAKLSPRFNLGAKYQLVSSLSLQGGAYVVPSAVKEPVDSDPSSNTYYGTTLGGSYFTGRVKSSLGFFFIWSNVHSENAVFTSNVQTRIYGALLTLSYLL